MCIRDRPYAGETLDFEAVHGRWHIYLEWLCKLYVNTMNVIHYMHDKYAYEKTQMALHDTNVERFMAFGVAGLSVLADSFSAIRYANVKVVRDENGLIEGFETTGEFPKYGNDDDRVDQIAKTALEEVYTQLKRNPTYRSAMHTLSVLTITSNVVSVSYTHLGRRGRTIIIPMMKIFCREIWGQFKILRKVNTHICFLSQKRL